MGLIPRFIITSFLNNKVKRDMIALTGCGSRSFSKKDDEAASLETIDLSYKHELGAASLALSHGR
jgi:hypothetical protein